MIKKHHIAFVLYSNSYIGDIDIIELLLVWIMDIITSQKSELGEISLNLPRRPHDPYYSLHLDFLIYMYMNIYRTFL